MDLIISNADNRPIYQQLYAQIKNQILSGHLPEGQPLPSIRALSKDLRISVITTKRAYDELEKDNLIYTVAGKGCYVAPMDTEWMREQHLREIEDHMRAILSLAEPLGLSEESLDQMLHLLAKEDGIL